MNMPNDNQHSPFQNSTFEKPVTALEERQQLLAHHVRLVARKHNHALFVYDAEGGLGKIYGEKSIVVFNDIGLNRVW